MLGLEALTLWAAMALAAYSSAETAPKPGESSQPAPRSPSVSQDGPPSPHPGASSEGQLRVPICNRDSVLRRTVSEHVVVGQVQEVGDGLDLRGDEGGKRP